MSQIRLYLDEDAMDLRLVNSLRTRRIDAVTARDAGMVQRPDEDHLRFATEQGRAIYTFNSSDFCRLHMAWMGAAGLMPASWLSRSNGIPWANNCEGFSALSAINRRKK